MIKILFILSIYRNACAHDERFYNLKAVNKNMRPNMIKTNNIHKQMRIPLDASGNPIYGKNDLFAVVIIFKLMLSENSFNKFLDSIRSESNQIQSQLKTISINDILKGMGFPLNWIDIKDI